MTIIVEDVKLRLSRRKTGPANGSYNGSSGTLIVTVGPITGGTPPYSVDFSHVSAFFKVLLRSERFAVNQVRDVVSSVAGDGVLEGGSAYAVMRFMARSERAGRRFSRTVYVPPGGFLVVSDSAGEIVTVRSTPLGQGALLENSNVI